MDQVVEIIYPVTYINGMTWLIDAYRITEATKLLGYWRIDV
jgi:hypothetical protein